MAGPVKVDVAHEDKRISGNFDLPVFVNRRVQGDVEIGVAVVSIALSLNVGCGGVGCGHVDIVCNPVDTIVFAVLGTFIDRVVDGAVVECQRELESGIVDAFAAYCERARTDCVFRILADNIAVLCGYGPVLIAAFGVDGICA